MRLSAPLRQQEWQADFSQLRNEFVRALEPLALSGALSFDHPTEMLKHSEFGEVPIMILTIDIEGIVVRLAPGLEPIIGYPAHAELAVQPVTHRSQKIDIYRVKALPRGEGWAFKTASLKIVDPFVKLDANFVPVEPKVIKAVIEQLLT